MQIKPLIPLAAILLVACAAPAVPPKGPAATAEELARLSPDPAQAKLWREAVSKGAVAGIESASVHDAPVRRRKALVIPHKPVEPARVAFPETVVSGMVILAAPELDEEFSGTVRIKSAKGEFLQFDLGKGRTLNLQTKVRGGPLRARAGETATLLLRRGSPFQRNDVLAIKLAEDDLVYALVGSDEPVRLSIASHSLSAEQIGELERNAMRVQVTIGGETRTLKPGDQADFQATGLTVKVLASVAVQGESAHVLPGQPYRLELLGWRTTVR